MKGLFPATGFAQCAGDARNKRDAEIAQTEERLVEAREISVRFRVSAPTVLLCSLIGKAPGC